MLRSITFWLIVALGSAVWLAWPRIGATIPMEQKAPELTGEHWINSRPLTMAGLRGRVVLVEFWTYG